MTRQPLFIGNWKMQMNCAETAQFAARFTELIELNPLLPDIGIAPAFTSIATLSESLAKTQGILIGAQNVHWLEKGAHTGEISADMLKEQGAQFVICGHSERRQFYGETDETVSLRANAAIRQSLAAIVCCGESQQQFEANQTEKVVEEQLKESLKSIETEHLSRLIIAYEPIWAIGTGLAATPDIAQRVHDFIRVVLTQLYGSEAQQVKILYGGSTKPENIAELVSRNNIDGALVGGASLTPESFAALIRNGRLAKAA